MSRPRALLDALQATILGQEDIVEGMILALIAGGHALLEGALGVAKTLACRARWTIVSAMAADWEEIVGRIVASVPAP